MVNGNREWATYTTQAVDDKDFIELGNIYHKEKNITVGLEVIL